MFTFVEGIIWVMDDRPRPQKIMQTSAFNLPRVRYSATLTESSTLGGMLLWTAACLCTSGFWGLSKSDTDVTHSQVPCVLNIPARGHLWFLILVPVVFSRCPHWEELTSNLG